MNEEVMKVLAMLQEGQITAEQAAQLIKVKYDVLPAVTDVSAAMRDDAPILHDDKSGLRRCGNAIDDVTEPVISRESIAQGLHRITHGQSA